MARTIDMTRGGPSAGLLKFALPLMASSLLQQLYNTVDSIIVGRFVGLEALAAVGLCGTVINLLISFVTGAANGIAVVAARFMGAKDEYRLRLCATVSLLATLVLALLISTVGVAVSEPLLQAIHTPADVMESALSYLRISFSLSSFMILYNSGSALLRAMGDAKTSLYFLLAACVSNVFLDYIFVVVFSMGTDGAAWATVLAQGVSAALVVLWLLKKVRPEKIERAARQKATAILREIAAIGLPTGIQQTIGSISGVIVQNLINAFGTLYIAANNIVVKVDHFCVMPIMSFSAALNTFVGQNVGAKRMDRVRRGARDGLLIGSGISLVSTAIMLLFGRYCMLLFTDDQSAIATAMTMLSIIAPFWIGMAAQQNVASILRGMGESVLPMAVSVLGLFLFRIPSAYLLYAATGNPFTCWWSMAMNWALCGLILLVYYVSGRWRQNRRIIRAMGDLFGQR